MMQLPLDNMPMRVAKKQFSSFINNIKRETYLIPKSIFIIRNYFSRNICISLIVCKKDFCTPREVFLTLLDLTQLSHCYTSPKSNRRTFGMRNMQQDWEIICIVE